MKNRYSRLTPGHKYSKGELTLIAIGYQQVSQRFYSHARNAYTEEVILLRQIKAAEFAHAARFFYDTAMTWSE